MNNLRTFGRGANPPLKSRGSHRTGDPPLSPPLGGSAFVGAADVLLSTQSQLAGQLPQSG
jgi:hypothetical protein